MRYPIMRQMFANAHIVFVDVVDDKTVTVIPFLYLYLIFIIIQFLINASCIKKSYKYFGERDYFSSRHFISQQIGQVKASIKCKKLNVPKIPKQDGNVKKKVNKCSTSW